MTARPMPWMKFSPDRWQRDEALRMCGAAARGVWAELICIMHKAEPYGHLLVRGKQPTDKQLAVITGLSITDVSNGLAELEENEVFSRNDDGVIFSRGMVRDAEQHERLSSAGSKGAARRYGKTKGKKTPHSQGDSPPHSAPYGLESEEESESDIKPPLVPPSNLGGPKTRLPDDWKPGPFDSKVEPAASRIWTKWDDDRRQRELDEFRANHRRKGNVSANWQDDWAKWVRNAEKFDTRDERERAERKPAQSSEPKSHADLVLERMRIEEFRPAAAK